MWPIILRKGMRKMANQTQPSDADFDRAIGDLAKRNLGPGVSEFAPRGRNSGPLALRPPKHDFVNLAEELAKNVTQAAEKAVAEAQLKLDETKQVAEELLTKMRAKDAELAELTNRLNVSSDKAIGAIR